MKPGIGRIVHYVSEGSPVLPDGSQKYASECRAAIVTEVNEYAPGSTGDRADEVGLFVANPTGTFHNRGVRHSEDENQGGTWHWPERVEREPGDRPQGH